MLSASSYRSIVTLARVCASKSLMICGSMYSLQINRLSLFSCARSRAAERSVTTRTRALMLKLCLRMFMATLKKHNGNRPKNRGNDNEGGKGVDLRCNAAFEGGVNQNGQSS